MTDRTVIFVVAHNGYQPIEYAVPKKILENAGYQVLTASSASGIATATDNSTAPVDLVIHDIIQAEADGIFFIGGPGALEHLDHAESYLVLQHAVEHHIPCGAICISSRILAKSGILKGKKATGWDGDGALKDIFSEYEVIYVPKSVVSDGSIVTATGPDAAREFGEQILSVLQEEKGWG